MLTSPDILDLQMIETVRPIAGYAVNIRPELMVDALKPFVVHPQTPMCVWIDDKPTPPMPPILPDGRPDRSAMAALQPAYRMVCLVFPDVATARASPLGRYWRDRPAAAA